LAAVGAVEGGREDAGRLVSDCRGFNQQMCVGVACSAPRLLSAWLMGTTGNIRVRGCGHDRRFRPRPGSWRGCSPQRRGPSFSGTVRG
jgi:hypothetical protein